MPTLTAHRPLRFLCDLASPNQVLEKTTGHTAVIARGAPTVFQLALARRRELFTILSGQIASLTVQVRASSDPASDLLLAKTIATGFSDALTLATWEDGSAQHCSVEFTDAECNLAAGTYWLAIWFTTPAGQVVPCAFGRISVIEDGAGNHGTPPEPLEEYYTREEVAALFALRVPAAGAFRISPDGAFIQLKDSVTGKFRSMWLQNGVPVFGPEVT